MKTTIITTITTTLLVNSFPNLTIWLAIGLIGAVIFNHYILGPDERSKLTYIWWLIPLLGPLGLVFAAYLSWDQFAADIQGRFPFKFQSPIIKTPNEDTAS